MKLTLKRIYKGPKYTIGHLYIDGKYYCDTLEDVVRDLSIEKKVPGETAIPAGTYDVIVNMSPKFGRELPRLVDVPNFSGILIHRGNTPKDTAGCILVGQNKRVGMVLNSTPYEVELTKKIKESNETTITIE